MSKSTAQKQKDFESVWNRENIRKTGQASNIIKDNQIIERSNVNEENLPANSSKIFSDNELTVRLLLITKVIELQDEKSSLITATKLMQT